MANRYQCRTCYSLPQKPIFFDANVLIYIFWPTGKLKWAAEYSAIFNTLLKQKNELALDSTVISEIVNRSIRIEYDKHLVTTGLKTNSFSFKSFRNSVPGKEALEEIYVLLNKKILPLFSVIGKCITKSDIESFLHVNSLDFSDKIILSLCRDHNCILLTNDTDFAQSDIDILSAHPVLLNS